MKSYDKTNHSFEQYRVDLQPPHAFMMFPPSGKSLSRFPQNEHDFPIIDLSTTILTLPIANDSIIDTVS